MVIVVCFILKIRVIIKTSRDHFSDKGGPIKPNLSKVNLVIRQSSWFTIFCVMCIRGITYYSLVVENMWLWNGQKSIKGGVVEFFKVSGLLKADEPRGFYNGHSAFIYLEFALL